MAAKKQKLADQPAAPQAGGGKLEARSGPQTGRDQARPRPPTAAPARAPKKSK